MSTGPTIAVVGASTRAAAFSLLKAGYRVVAADLFADADLQRACPTTRIEEYPSQLIDWLTSVECAGWFYCGALENHPDLIDQLAQLKPLLGNPGDVLRRVRDPLLLQNAVHAAGSCFPRTLPNAGRPLPDGMWLHKTGQGGGGSGVARVVRDTDSAPGRGGYLQEFVTGASGSAVYLGSAVASHLLGITRQLVGERWLHAREFQYCGSICPWNLSEVCSQLLEQLGELLVSEFGLRGLFGIDFVFDGQRVWPVEINPRVTASVEAVERATGVHALAKHVETFRSKIPQQFGYRSPRDTHGKAILFASRSIVVSSKLTESLLSESEADSTPQLADIPTAGTQIAVGEPILTAFAQGKSVEATEQELRRRVATIEAALYGDP